MLIEHTFNFFYNFCEQVSGIQLNIKRTRSEGEDCDNDNNDGETCSGEEPKKLDSLQRRI